MLEGNGATWSRRDTHFACLIKGPILFTGMRTASLLKKDTKRKRDAGDRDSSIGKAALSRQSEVGDTPRLASIFITSSDDRDPLFVNNPGHDLKTYTMA